MTLGLVCEELEAMARDYEIARLLYLQAGWMKNVGLRNARGAIIYEGRSEIHQLMQAGYALGYRHDSELRCELPRYDEKVWRGSA